MKLKFLAAVGLAATFYSCDDTTTGVGEFVADADEITASAQTFEATTKTLKYTDLNPKGVFSRTSSAYLGKFTDPDFGTYTTDFITQINCTEGFEFPETTQEIVATTLELSYASFFGDSLAPMRVRVDMLDKAIDDTGEDLDLYYTSYNPIEEGYYNPQEPALAEQDYAVRDNSWTDEKIDSIKGANGYYPPLIIDLDKKKSSGIGEDEPGDFSQYLLNKYKENKDYFKDAYSFIHKVLPGFYVHNTGGEGSILYIGDIWLRMKVKYLVERPSTGAIDSVVYTSIPFAATNEVFMSTRLSNSEETLNNLAGEKQHTYLKTPAGLCTEVKLPLQEMYDALGTDTLNSVSMSFTKYKNVSDNSEENPYKMGTPKNLLLIRKNEVKDFFEKRKNYDSKTTFLGTYSSTTNSYSFSQVNRLISQIFSDMRTKEEPAEGWDEYNTMVLIPVKTETDSQGNTIGLSHDLEVNSAKLIGGEEGEKIKMEVIYTKPKFNK
ncbi:DUF4270 domain-containing protein [Phocaeicola plebeius]|uniref:DUF4270 domain-containing protein n=1 Tax=Phocaeicola plebeius TaxID=310297 RepID=UPI0026EF765C|nr:DUF4270 domain-containing protein [Phocaeicola plebeius]MDD6913174.1 DUF4270 domain-containing protein [Phocaeicola plebeius]MDY5977236.1 DUF4270 domain-containing protein [Phocaeicola plebeius]